MASDLARYRFYSASLIALASSGVAVARPSSAQGNAGAKLKKPIEIISTAGRYNSLGLSNIAPPPSSDFDAVEWSSLYFGSISPPLSGSATVSLSPDGVRTCPGNIICLTEDHHAAKFGVVGEANRFFTVSVPATITVTNGGASMVIENVIPSQTTGFLQNGYGEFYIGGDLIILAGQALGDYSGTYQVTVEYQ